MDKKITVLHGPNLNLLGRREPQHYGSQSLEEINERLKGLALAQEIELTCFQSNSEGTLIDYLQKLPDYNTQFIIFNPAAWTHTSIALRDTLLAIRIPFIEVHLSNVYARETFRQHSYFSDIATGTISGFGALSYELALQASINYLKVA